MKVFKSVSQRFTPDSGLMRKMDMFRDMVNDCLRLGLEANISAFVELKPLCSPRMLQYNTEPSYRTSAIFEAGRVLQKYKTDSKRRRVGRPYCRKAFLTASLSIRVDEDELVLPDGRRIKLNPRTLSVLSQPGVRANSVTITTWNLGICYWRTAPKVGILGAVALDVNLENVTCADSEGRSQIYDLTPLTRIHETYRRVTSRFRRHDRRVRGSLLRKYGSIEVNRRRALLHNVSSAIVGSALRSQRAIIMEDLRGIKEMFGRESKSTAAYLSKMNSWPFGRLRTQVFYKAQWEGLPVVWVDPQGTSNECSECGGGMLEQPERHPMIRCRVCGRETDRDLNSAQVILKKGMKRLGLRFGQAGPAVEAMGGTGDRKDRSDAKVDAGQSFGHPE